MSYVDGEAFGDAKIALARATDLNADMPPVGRPLGDWIRWLIFRTSRDQKVETLETLRKYRVQMITTMSTEPDGQRFDAVISLPEKARAGK